MQRHIKELNKALGKLSDAGLIRHVKGGWVRSGAAIPAKERENRRLWKK